MAHTLLKIKAISMRQNGMSYSQIKAVIPVSKSTLSAWLEGHPLSPEKLRELRDLSPERIESYRATMKKKREARIATQGSKASDDLGKFSHRELFIAGFFLFWGEGAKSRKAEVSLANTDPAMAKFFLQWLVRLGAHKDKIHFTLHLYSDMNEKKELKYWSEKLGYPLTSFYKPYIKKTKITDLTHRNGFGHGTCNVRYLNQNLNDYILMGLKQIRSLYEKA